MTPWPTIMLSSTETRETRHLATELKFLITPSQARQIGEWARARLAPDTHGSGSAGDEYRTTSLYFDTHQFDVFHRRGSFGRAKYRIRRYGHEHVVFLERKMRTSSLLAKRRTIVDLDHLALLQQDGRIAEWEGGWFHQRLIARGLQPQVQVGYSRTARVGESAWGPIRLTLDDQLRAVPACDLGFRNETGRPVLPDRAILELKYRAAMPVLFKELVQDFSLIPARLSKYRLAIEAIRPRALAMVSRPAAGLQLQYA